MASPMRVAAYAPPGVAGQFQLQGITMGYGTPFMVTEVEGLGVQVVPSDTPRSLAHGSFGGSDLVQQRDLIFHITVAPGAGDPPLWQLLQQLKAAFAPSQRDQALVWNFPWPGWDSLVALGRPRKCDGPWPMKGAVAPDWLALFTALDPRMYGATLRDQAIAYPGPGTLAGIPFRTAANLGMTFAPQPRPVQNSGFEEAAVTPWITAPTVSLWVAGATLTRDGAQAHSGAVSGKVVTDGLAANEGVYQVTAIPNYFVPGSTYTVTCWVFANSAGAKLQLNLNDGTNALNTTSPSVATPTGVWTQLSVTFTIGPTLPGTIRFGVRDNGTAVARTFWVDDFQFTPGAVAQAYTPPSAIMGVSLGAVAGGAGAAGVQAVTNGGNADTAPVSRIYGPATGPLLLTRVESGEVITVNLNLGAADHIELDHDLRTCILNDNTARMDAVDSSTVWWQLPPGQSTIQYRTVGASPGSSADIKWRDAWW